MLDNMPCTSICCRRARTALRRPCANQIYDDSYQTCGLTSSCPEFDAIEFWMSTSGIFWEAFLTRHGVSFPASGAAADELLTLSKAV